MLASDRKAPKTPSPVQECAYGSPQGSSSSSSSSDAGSESSSSSSSEDEAASSSDSEPEDAIALAEFAHGQEKDHTIHFLVHGGLPGCAKNVQVRPEGFGLGWADLKSRGRSVCSFCAHRFSTSPAQIAARLVSE